MKRILLGLVLAGFLATPAQADDKFGKMDTSGDGKVTWEEFQVAYPQMQRAAFDGIDTDKKGYFTHEDWHTFLAGHQKSMEQSNQGSGMGGGMGGGMPPAGHPGDGSSKPMIMPPKK